MKYVEVSVASNYKLGDETEIVTHPTEGVICIKKDGKYYSPSLVWMEFHPEGDPEAASSDVTAGTSEDEPGLWIELELEEEEKLVDEALGEYVDIREITEDELDEDDEL